jgi:hypothetical protein
LECGAGVWDEVGTKACEEGDKKTKESVYALQISSAQDFRKSAGDPTNEKREKVKGEGRYTNTPRKKPIILLPPWG